MAARRVAAGPVVRAAAQEVVEAAREEGVARAVAPEAVLIRGHRHHPIRRRQPVPGLSKLLKKAAALHRRRNLNRQRRRHPHRQQESRDGLKVVRHNVQGENNGRAGKGKPEEKPRPAVASRERGERRGPANTARIMIIFRGKNFN